MIWLFGVNPNALSADIDASIPRNIASSGLYFSMLAGQRSQWLQLCHFPPMQWLSRKVRNKPYYIPNYLLLIWKVKEHRDCLYRIQMRFHTMSIRQVHRLKIWRHCCHTHAFFYANLKHTWIVMLLNHHRTEAAKLLCLGAFFRRTRAPNQYILAQIASRIWDGSARVDGASN